MAATLTRLNPCDAFDPDEVAGADHGLDDDQLAEALPQLFADLRRYAANRRLHDRDGFFADFAGSTACLELGHRPNEDAPFGEQWVTVPDHEYGFDSVICLTTRRGVCCTVCEGECMWAALPQLWQVPAVTGEAR